LLILGGIIAARGKSELAIVAVAGIIVSGSLTWIIGRPASHVGASGLIFCFFGYLASLAFFHRTIGSFVLSAICILLYGGMLRGIVPTATAISWEGHIAGLIAGVYLAWDASKSNSSGGNRKRRG
jgi:membrane associated rhomboid family serine protease